MCDALNSKKVTDTVLSLGMPNMIKIKKNGFKYLINHAGAKIYRENATHTHTVIIEDIPLQKETNRIDSLMFKLLPEEELEPFFEVGLPSTKTIVRVTRTITYCNKCKYKSPSKKFSFYLASLPLSEINVHQMIQNDKEYWRKEVHHYKIFNQDATQ